MAMNTLRKLNRWIVLGAILVIATVVLVACGGGDSEKAASSGAERQAAPTSRIASRGPSISWNPTSLTQTIKPGETRTVIATLTALTSTPSSVIRVVPELQPYVSVSPTTTGPLTPNQSVAFAVTFSAPIDALPVTSTGTVQLRTSDSAGNTLAQPLPIAVSSVWPVALTRNGAAISYPGTFSINQKTNAHTNSTVITNFGGTYAKGGLIPRGGADVVVTTLPPLSESLDSYLSRQLTTASATAQSSLAINGRPGVKVSYTEAFSPLFSMRYVEAYVSLPSALYKVSLSFNTGDESEQKFLNLFDVMLSSVKLPQ